MGAFAPPVLYSEVPQGPGRGAAMAPRTTSFRVWKEFGERVRALSYSPIETYRTEDAETLLVGIGQLLPRRPAVAVDKPAGTRAEKVGLVRLRLWRPVSA
ncbi:MAG: hypothetical protein MZU91_06615 [Desulfosudis oleivorans]|nr:hypothetical protein [Desulfosudis oleivorans]